MSNRSAPPAAMDFEPAGELKIGQVGVANLRIRTLDVARLGEEMRERVSRAPKLFARAAVIVDFGGLPGTPDVATARALLDALREAGALPVALDYGSNDNEQLAITLGLPLLSKFRAQYERADGSPADDPAAPAPAAREPAAAPARSPTTRQVEAAAQPGLVHVAPVRSGQQVYADSRDLTDAGLQALEGRRQRDAELGAAITAWTRRYSAAEAAARLQQAGIAAAPMLRVEELARDAQLVAANFFCVVPRALSGPQVQMGPPIKPGGRRIRAQRPAPLLGEHTRALLRTRAGVDDAAYRQLVPQAVVSCVPTPVRNLQ